MKWIEKYELKAENLIQLNISLRDQITTGFVHGSKIEAKRKNPGKKGKIEYSLSSQQ
jgi:hypothetical protein